VVYSILCCVFSETVNDGIKFLELSADQQAILRELSTIPCALTASRAYRAFNLPENIAPFLEVSLPDETQRVEKGDSNTVEYINSNFFSD